MQKELCPYVDVMQYKFLKVVYGCTILHLCGILSKIEYSAFHLK